MIGEGLIGPAGAVAAAWGALSDGRLSVLLATQATCCIAAGLTTSYLWRRRAARAHQAIVISLLACILMPATYLLVRQWGLGVLTPPIVAAGPSVAVTTPGETAVVDEDPSDSPSAFDSTEPDLSDATWDISAVPGSDVPWPAIFVGCSLITGASLFGRLLWQFILGRRLLDRAQPIESGEICNALEAAKARMGIRSPVQLRCSRDVCSPLIWCWRRVPVLLVHKQTSHRPQRCDWVSIFCHELAHWKRKDHVTGLFCELLLCAVPWHPLLWWARSRLATLSEEACDDWALAGGQAGVDYAESLLGLSPQAQMAFLPTVVGKEKAMKERICRILKDRCGNPKVGMRWAVLVGAAAICTSVTVALAQPRPLPGPEAQPRAALNPPMRPAPPFPPEQRPLAMQGRRNVINRMLDNLREQRRHAEMELQERGDRQDDQTVILRSELLAIRNHIDALEQQLQNVERPMPLRAAPQAGARGGERRIIALQNQIAEAEARLKRLENQGQGDSEQAQQTREILRQSRAQLEQARQQLLPEPAQPQPAPGRPRAQGQPGEGQVLNPAPVRPQVQLQEQVQQLQNQMNNLNRQLAQMQRTLNQLVQQRSGGEPQQRQEPTPPASF
jgi:beta-lactamase regulating signal transducer with metallopeptidase domain